MIKLRDYQQDILDRTRHAFRQGKKRPLIVLPCGAGKTVCFAYMADLSQRKGNNVWFLVHRQELLHQTLDTFRLFGIPLDTIHIGMVGSALRQADKLPKPDFIIFDEAHHATAQTWKKIIDRFPDAHMCGLTATPCRLDGKPLGAVFDCLLEGISAQELIDTGYLAPYQYYAPAVADLTGLQRKGRDYDAAQATEILSSKAIFGDVIEHYRNYANGLQAICYCVSIQHSQSMAEAFKAEGINAVHFDGNTPKRERESIIERYRNGEIDILCNVDLISEGFDVPDCHCCILLRPTMSTTLFIQQSMRALRPQEGKTAIILDHVGNYTRHGLPTDEREWSLSNKLKQRKQYGEDGKLTVTQCLECFATYPSASKCPFCGTVRELTQKEIENIKEIKLEEIKQAKREKAAKAVQNKSVNELRTLQEYQEYAKQKGYKSGYAWILWQKSQKRKRKELENGEIYSRHEA